MTGRPEVGNRVSVTAPVRVADVGGWTDTWFGSPGRVCSMAVGPGVRVDVEVVALPTEDADLPVRIVAPNLGEDYRMGPSPDHGWLVPRPGRQPLLEHAVGEALDHTPLPDGCGVEVSISSLVPVGASLGTSASVVVAILGALDALAGGARSPGQLAAAAHRVETDRVGRESGVQDQWAAAIGGCGLLTVNPYPQVRHDVVELAADTVTAINDRLVTVVFGPHDSSAVHDEVIDAMVGCGGPTHDRARQALGRLASLAVDAADSLRVGSIDGWAEILSAATETQRLLHPGLVGGPHAQAIEVASAEGAAGWKVNGAGGDGGSLTVVAADRNAATHLAQTLGRVDRWWRVVELAPAAGLRVVSVEA